MVFALAAFAWRADPRRWAAGALVPAAQTTASSSAPIAGIRTCASRASRLRGHRASGGCYGCTPKRNGSQVDDRAHRATPRLRRAHTEPGLQTFEARGGCGPSALGGGQATSDISAPPGRLNRARTPTRSMQVPRAQATGFPDTTARLRAPAGFGTRLEWRVGPPLRAAALSPMRYVHAAAGPPGSGWEGAFVGQRAGSRSTG